MNTFTLAFKALIIIFLSTGPVISTLLLSKLFGISLTCQDAFLISSVSDKKVGKIPEST